MSSSSTKSGFKATLPITGTARSIFSKIDDHGYASDISREDGESIHNFRTRLYRSNALPGSATIVGLTDSINREFGLGQEYLVEVTPNQDFVLNVSTTSISLSGLEVSNINIINVDIDGYWNLKNMQDVVNDLNLVSGISASLFRPEYSGMPAILLEEQSSIIKEYNESVPYSTQFTLGMWEHGEPVNGKIINNTVHFTDDHVFANEVSGIPNNPGDWSIDLDTKIVRSYLISTDNPRISYERNILTSGQTMLLVGNGAKIVDLSDSNIQSTMFLVSGIGETGKIIVKELQQADKTFWGK